MTFNLDLAVTMLARIELGQLDSTWNQKRWALLPGSPVWNPEGGLLLDDDGLPVGAERHCGTAHCAAGFVLAESDIGLSWFWSDFAKAFSADFTADGENIPTKACELLGIFRPSELDDFPEEHWDFSEEMPRMFAGGNTIDDIYEEVLHYAGDLVSSKEALIDLVTQRIVALTQASVAGPTSTHPV